LDILAAFYDLAASIRSRRVTAFAIFVHPVSSDKLARSAKSDTEIYRTRASSFLD
jgi:hypothetical protein